MHVTIFSTCLCLLTLSFQGRPEYLHQAAQQGHGWSTALLAKKAAMENLLKAQKSLEEIEESIAEHLSKESIEGAHARFLSTLNPSHPDALYLPRVGQIVIRPLSSRLVRPSCIRPTQEGSVYS